MCETESNSELGREREREREKEGESGKRGGGGGGGGNGDKQRSIAAATLARLVGSLVAGHVVPLSSLLPREGGGGGGGGRAASAAAPNDAAAAAAAVSRCGLSAGSDALAALLPARRVALWRSLLRHALAAAPDRAAAASPFERMSAAALAARKNAGSKGGGRAPGRDSDGGEDDLDGFAEARLEKGRRKDKGADASSSPAPQGPAFPPLDASEACSSLRSFIRRFVVPGVDGSSSSVPSSGSMFGGVSLDELTLRARGAERALAAGAKAGQSLL